MTAADEDSRIEAKWRKIAEDARNEATTLPPCEKRDNLLKKARQLDVAVTLNNWLSTPASK